MLILRVLLHDTTRVKKKNHHNFIRIMISMCWKLDYCAENQLNGFHFSVLKTMEFILVCSKSVEWILMC